MEKIINKYEKRKVFWICYIILALGLIILTIISYNLYNNHSYKGTKLKLVTVEDTNLVMKDSNDNSLVMTSVLPNKRYTITYLNETLGYESIGGESIFTFSDGSQLAEPLFSTLVEIEDGYEYNGDNSGLTENQISEKNLIMKLDKYYNDYRPNSDYIVYDFVGLLLILLGTWSFFYPKEAWRLETLFIVKNGEPTDWAIFSNKAVGVVAVIYAYGSIVWLMVSN